MTVIGTVRAVRRHGIGLHLGRLAQAPGVEPSDLADQPGELGVQLRGVVCGVCAARTQSALASVPGVESAVVDLQGSRAVLRLSPGATVDVTQLQRALEGVVIGMGVRRRIEGLVGRLGNLAGRASWQASQQQRDSR